MNLMSFILQDSPTCKLSNKTTGLGCCNSSDITRHQHVMRYNHPLLSLACATEGLSSTLGESSKAIRHICELQSQRRREEARELVVLRYNVTNCCVHGLKIRSYNRIQVLIGDNSDPSCERHFRCFPTATSTNTAVQKKLRL